MKTRSTPNPRAKRVLALTTGMHRSGTSLCANILHLLGVDMTTEYRIGVDENERGFWERFEFTMFHNKILTHLGRAWGGALHSLPIPPGWWRHPNFRELNDELTDLARIFFDNPDRPFGIKDPRLCLLMPMWTNLASRLDLDVKVIINIRHPLAVAASLKRRDGFDHAYSLYMWLAYNLNILNSTSSEQRLIVEYETWFKAPLEQAGRLLDFLGIPWTGTDKEFEQVVTNAIQVDLKHHKADQDDMFWKPARMLFREFLTVVGKGGSGELDTLSANLWEHYITISPLLPTVEGALTSQAETIAKVQHTLEGRNAELNEARAGIALCQSEKDVIAKDSTVQSNRIKALEENLTATQSERDTNSARATEMEGVLAVMRSEKDADSARIKALEEEVGRNSDREVEHNISLMQLTSQCEAAHAEIESLKRQIERHLHDLQQAKAILNSSNPKVLTPLLGFKDNHLSLGVLVESDEIVGFIDGVRFEEGGYVVRGWAWDMETRYDAAAIFVFDDKGPLGWCSPNVSRPDVASAYGAVETGHFGFELRLPRAVEGRIRCFGLGAHGKVYPLKHG